MGLAWSADLDLGWPSAPKVDLLVCGNKSLRMQWASETKQKRKAQNAFNFNLKLVHDSYGVFIAWKTRSNPPCLKSVLEHTPTSKWPRQNQLLVYHKNKSQCVKIELLSKLCKQENLISLKFPTWTPFLLFSKQAGQLSGNVKRLPGEVT